MRVDTTGFRLQGFLSNSYTDCLLLTTVFNIPLSIGPKVWIYLSLILR